MSYTWIMILVIKVHRCDQVGMRWESSSPELEPVTSSSTKVPQEGMNEI